MILHARILAPLLLILGAACSPSILVRPGDRAFARAEKRLAATFELVERSGAPAGERALFLQAEGFHRYRFAAQARGAGSLLAEAGAILIELPVLQALAGSLDLTDLRMRADDPAAQLWETLLARHPDSRLRPLALYRLGWAYRNVQASGFPRDSGGAFDLLIHESPPAPLLALAREAKQVPWKSKDGAAAWSLLPGAGQIYAGETGNGILRLAIAALATAAIVVPSVIAYQRRSELGWSTDWPLLAVGTAGVLALSFDYTSSYEQAMSDVVHFNERAEATFEDAHPSAP